MASQTEGVDAGEPQLELVNGSAEATGTEQTEQAEQVMQGEQIACRDYHLARADALVPAVTVHLPSPVHSRTLPKKSTPEEVFHTITLIPQPHETVQELKLAINEWVGGYWLGPYSLRLPAAKPEANGHSEGEEQTEATGQLGKSREGIDVRAGVKLSEWLEVGEVFSHLKEGEARVLEVVRGGLPVVRHGFSLTTRTVFRLLRSSISTPACRAHRSRWNFFPYKHFSLRSYSRFHHL